VKKAKVVVVMQVTDDKNPETSLRQDRHVGHIDVTDNMWDSGAREHAVNLLLHRVFGEILAEHR